MQTFQTAAVVGLIDNMSGPLKTLAKQAKELAKVIDAGKIDPTGAQQTAAAMRQANAAAKEHLSIAQRIHATWKGIGGIVAGVAAGKLAHGSIEAIQKYAPLESATRYQKAIGNYSDADMSRLDKQMQTAVDKWGMKLLDTKEAQQVFTTRNFSAPITEAATNASIILGRAMNTSAVDAGKMIEGAVFGQGIHLKDPATARLETMRAADMAAIAAKKGAMTPEDIQQLNIYGAAPAHAAGLTPEQVYATGMTFKRANIDGTQAGTFIRAASSRLMAPTSMGRDALTLMLARQGKTLDDFTHGGDLSPEAIDKAMAQNARGRRLGAKGIASLRSAIDEGIESGDPEKDVMGNRAAFSAAVRKALEDSGQTFDKGEVPKMVGQALRLRDIAREKVKLDALYENILHNATPQEKIKIFGDKQGGRAGSLNPEQYDEYRKAEASSGGYAEKIATERMEGLNASIQRLTAAFDGFENKMVQANEGWLTKLTNSLATSFNWVSGLNDVEKEALTAAGALASLYGAAKGVTTALGIIGNLKGGTKAGLPGEMPVVPEVPGVPKFVKPPHENPFWPGGMKNPTFPEGHFEDVPETLAKAGKLGKALRGIGWLSTAIEAGYETKELYDATLGGGSESERDTDALQSMYKRVRRENQLFGSGGKRRPAMSMAGINGDNLSASSTSWADSVRTSWEAPKAAGDSKWGDGSISKQIQVEGTVKGATDLAITVTGEIRPTTYLEGIIHRAESNANISLSGVLGTSMQGPGDNGTKTSPGGALTGTK